MDNPAYEEKKVEIDGLKKKSSLDLGAIKRLVLQINELTTKQLALGNYDDDDDKYQQYHLYMDEKLDLTEVLDKAVLDYTDLQAKIGFEEYQLEYIANKVEQEFINDELTSLPRDKSKESLLMYQDKLKKKISDLDQIIKKTSLDTNTIKIKNLLHIMIQKHDSNFAFFDSKVKVIQELIRDDGFNVEYNLDHKELLETKLEEVNTLLASSQELPAKKPRKPIKEVWKQQQGLIPRSTIPETPESSQNEGQMQTDIPQIPTSPEPSQGGDYQDVEFQQEGENPKKRRKEPEKELPSEQQEEFDVTRENVKKRKVGEGGTSQNVGPKKPPSQKPASQKPKKVVIQEGNHNFLKFAKILQRNPLRNQEEAYTMLKIHAWKF
jgi:hypothetical protein